MSGAGHGRFPAGLAVRGLADTGGAAIPFGRF